MLLSIIVPVYKTESCLESCIESILCTNERDMELILVDDGSPDSCPEICEHYAEIDDRVSVIHKENEGLANAARLRGAEESRGRYLLFVDSDDMICPEAIHAIREVSGRYLPDLICFSRFKGSADGQVLEQEPVPLGIYTEKRLREQIYPKMILDKDMEHLQYYITGCAVKRELMLRALRHSVSRRLVYGEDLLCRVSICLASESIYVCKDPGYRYRIRSGSITQCLRPGYFDDVRLIVRELIRLGKEKGSADIEAQARRYYFYQIIVFLNRIAIDRDRAALCMLRDRLLDDTGLSLVREADFGHISLKSRLLLLLIRLRLICPAYLLERIARALKGLGHGKGSESRFNQ